MAYRIDRLGSLRPARKMQDGRLRVDAYLTRTGVFKYRNADGTIRREYRPDSEVSSTESLASFEALPVTDDHPPVMLTDENRQRYARGATGESIHMDGDHVAGTLVVFDAELIRKMEAGKVQVSNGYTCDLEHTPGFTPTGEPYDCVQRNIRGNHVAIVHAGRAGSARVRMDADGAEQIEPPSAAINPKGIKMDLEQALQALGEMKAKAEAEAKRADAEKARADQADQAKAKAEGERDAAKARADQAEQARKDGEAAAQTKFDAAVAAEVERVRKDAEARVDCETKARTVLGADAKFDGKDLRTIKCEVIKAVCKVDVAADKADAYVDARFDGALEMFAAGATGAAAALGATGSQEHARKDAVNAEKSAAAKLNDHLANAWKAPEGK